LLFSGELSFSKALNVFFLLGKCEECHEYRN
jgi:hypothetical protein